MHHGLMARRRASCGLHVVRSCLGCTCNTSQLSQAPVPRGRGNTDSLSSNAYSIPWMTRLENVVCTDIFHDNKCDAIRNIFTQITPALFSTAIQRAVPHHPSTLLYGYKSLSSHSPTYARDSSLCCIEGL